MSLKEYRHKRNFAKTSEPTLSKKSKGAPIFVVQEHWASHHHFDFRLEAFGTLKSWAVPKGPPVDVGDKRLAVEVEDHPISYASFKGEIPEGEYGAGKVEIWDKGHWIPPEQLGANLKKGHLEFELKGKKLKGKWLLQRTGKSSGRKSQWLLIKRHDDKVVSSPKKSTKKKRDAWPKEVSPQLATLVDKVPKGGDWIHEIKLDGYRTLGYLRNSKVELRTRNGLNWTEKYPNIEKALQKLKVKEAIVDGEIVVLDEEGRSNFSSLQSALKSKDSHDLQFHIFDLLYFDGVDLRKEPLETRKLELKKMLKGVKSEALVFSRHWRDQGTELFKAACQNGLEGIISKNRNREYYEGRSEDWLKIKCTLRQELVIGGYTDPQGSRAGLGALLMGIYEGKGKDRKLKHVGRVGTGFNSKVLNHLMTQLEKIETDKSPFDLKSPSGRGLHWVKPKLVAEIEFRTWTADGNVRQASFQGLREDKKAIDVVMELPKPTKKTKKTESKTSDSKFKISHGDRIIFPKDKITKLDLANYYRSVAPWLLKYSSGRPLSLVRCPSGAGSQCFFQKHLDSSKMTDVLETQIEDQKVNYIESLPGLMQMIQWGVLELHTWQSGSEDFDHPNQIIFDLDPDEKLKWKQIVDAAFELKDLLDRLKFKSFVKTTGGKGVHIHVPIAAKYSWDQVKAFSKSVVTQLQSENPDLYVVNMSKAKRKGKIFLDYLRNGMGSTAIAPYSVRNREHPYVAVPITWLELKKLKGPQVFDIKSTLKRLMKQKSDPWQGMNKLKQKIKILE